MLLSLYIDQKLPNNMRVGFTGANTSKVVIQLFFLIMGVKQAYVDIENKIRATIKVL